jgi:hypothetical protein
MITHGRGIRRFLPVMLMIGLLAASKAEAYGGGHGGGHSGGGHAPRAAAHFSGGQRAYKAPRMSNAGVSPRVSTASTRASTAGTRTNTSGTRANTAGTRTGTAGTQARANTSQTRGTRAQSLASNTKSGTSRAARTGALGATTSTALNPTGTTSNGLSSNNYTYGTGNGARNYRAHGYGNGYRNRRSGYGYGRSQGNNRAVVARLRSVHASLARINHNYQGHRANAMNSVSMAIRQLSHRSMGYSSTGFSSGMMNNGMMNNGRAMGMRQGAGGANAGNRQRQPLTQAQSDSRMSQNLRTLQGINMQLGSQGSYNSGHSGASGHVRRAIRELHVALSIR